MKAYKSEIDDMLRLVPVDYRAECVARELTEQGGIQAENILQFPVGAFYRPFGQEIEQVNFEKSLDGRADSLSIKVHRESLLDMLPPGLVFQIDAAEEDRPPGRMVEDAERFDAQIAQARLFFAPYEIEFGHIRLALEIFEHQSWAHPLRCYEDDLFELLWPGLLLPISNDQKTLLLELSLCLSQVCGSHGACERYFEKFFGYPARLERCQTQEPILTNAHGVGEVVLGVDMIPFESFEDKHHVRIHLGPVPREAMVDFRQQAPVGKSYQLLSFLCDILLPVEFSWSLMLIPRESGFRIDSKPSNGILGYSTIPG